MSERTDQDWKHIAADRYHRIEAVELENEQLRADLERHRRLVARYRQPMVDGGIKPRERLHVLQVRAVDAETERDDLRGALGGAAGALERCIDFITSEHPEMPSDLNTTLGVARRALATLRQAAERAR